LINTILSSIDANAVHGFLYEGLWEKAFFWRYTTIVAIFLMIIYKRKMSHFENLFKQLDNDKKIVRKAFFIFSEVKMKDLMKNLINNNAYSAEQLDDLQELKVHLEQSIGNILNENLKKSAGELKVALVTGLQLLDEYFTLQTEEKIYKLKVDSKMDSVDEFELQDKVLMVITAFESKYFNFVQEVKDEFI